MGKQVVGIQNEEELASLLASCTFRALKKDWRKGMPPKVYTTFKIRMTKRQQQHYLDMMEDFYTQVLDKDVQADMVLVQMEKLRQIASGLVMIDGSAHWVEEPKSNPRLQGVVDLLDNAPNKVIVTCVYKASVDMLVEQCRKMKLFPAVIRGGMSPQEWQSEKRLFNDNPKCRVLIGQQSATFRGHTLIGGTNEDRCNHMVFYENNFSYYERTQLEDRIHRGAQDQTCQYTDFIGSPVDQHTRDIVLGKKKMADVMDALVAEARERKWD